jgi:hypothetical protein
MIAEREVYHSRVFQRRLAELGGEERATTTEEGRRFRDVLAAPQLADEEKLAYFTNYVGSPRTPFATFATSLPGSEMTRARKKR